MEINRSIYLFSELYFLLFISNRKIINSIMRAYNSRVVIPPTVLRTSIGSIEPASEVDTVGPVEFSISQQYHRPPEYSIAT